MKRLNFVSMILVCLLFVSGCSALQSNDQPGVNLSGSPVKIPSFQKTGGSCAWEAVTSCDSAALNTCLQEEGAEINMTDKEGRTLLHYAAGSLPSVDMQYECLFNVAYLALEGVDVNAQDKNGATPLHYASYAANELAVVYLSSRHNADTQVRDRDGRLPLDYVFSSFPNGNPSSHELAYRKNIVDFLNLLKKGSVGIPFSKEILMSYVEGVVYSQLEQYDKSAEKFAKAIDDCELAKDCPIDLATLRYSRGIAYFMANDCTSAMDDILYFINNNSARGSSDKADKTVETQVKNSWSILTACASSGGSTPRPDTSVTPAKQPDVQPMLTVTPQNTTTSLTPGRQIACIQESSASCDLNALIACGAITDLNVSDELGRTPLHLASGAFSDIHGELGCLSTVVYLIKEKANVNADDQNGATPLHYASQAGTDLIVMYLVAKDADYNKTDKDGLTPLDYAKQEYAKSSSPRYQNVITYFKGKAGAGVLVPQAKYAQINLAEGIVDMGIEDLDDATAKFTSVIDMCSDNEDCRSTASFLAYWYRGQIYFNQGNCKNAKPDFENFVTQYKLSDKNASNQVLKQMYTLAQDWLLACNGG